MPRTGRQTGRAPNPRGAPAQSSTSQTAPPVKTSDVVDDSNRWYPGHKGIDLITDGAKPIYACVKAEVIDVRGGGWWGIGNPGGSVGAKGDGIVRIKAVEDVGDVKKGTVFGYGHAESASVKVGDIVEAGTYLGQTGFANAWHTHWFVGAPGSDARDGDQDPLPYWQAFKNGTAQLTGVTPPAGDSGGGGGVDAAAAETAFKAASFATYLQLPGVLESATSIALKGERSLMNDQPLLPFIIQLTQACLRNFQSLPDGSFFAFYPDYFGGQNHRTPYWDISDIEILEGQIQLSDDALATHVYVVGDTVGNFDGVTVDDMIQSQGVVTLFNAFLADFMNPVAFEKQNSNSKDSKADAAKNFTALADKDNAIAFLQKYGVRPHYDAAPMVRSRFYEGFLAYQTFCLLWSRQFTSSFSFTFMPEVFPGGIVRFPNHGLQMYVDEVSHTFDYATGFETHAVLIAPASTEADRGQYPIHEGMIRAGAMAPKVSKT